MSQTIDGRSSRSREEGPYLYTGHAGPIHGPAFLWEQGWTHDPRTDRWEPHDKPVDVLAVWAMEYHYGEWMKFRDDLFWRYDECWGGPGISAYTRYFDDGWCWVRSDGILLASVRTRFKEDHSAGAQAARDGLRLLVEHTADCEPFDPRPNRDSVREKLHAIGVEIP